MSYTFNDVEGFHADTYGGHYQASDDFAWSVGDVIFGMMDFEWSATGGGQIDGPVDWIEDGHVEWLDSLMGTPFYRAVWWGHRVIGGGDDQSTYAAAWTLTDHPDFTPAGVDNTHMMAVRLGGIADPAALTFFGGQPSYTVDGFSNHLFQIPGGGTEGGGAMWFIEPTISDDATVSFGTWQLDDELSAVTVADHALIATSGALDWHPGIGLPNLWDRHTQAGATNVGTVWADAMAYGWESTIPAGAIRASHRAARHGRLGVS